MVAGHTSRTDEAAIRAVVSNGQSPSGARFDKSPVEQKSGWARFGREDLLGDVANSRSSDVRLRTERIEDLPGSGDEGCDASRTERAHDIPRVRCHESKASDTQTK